MIILKNSMLTGTKGVITSVATGLAVGAMVGAIVKGSTMKSSSPAKRTASVALGAMGDAMSYIAKTMK